MSSTYQLIIDADLIEHAARAYKVSEKNVDASAARLAANESCALLADVPAGLPQCRFARTCRSCLQKRTSSSACMVDSTGLCSDPRTNDFATRRHFKFAYAAQRTSATRQRWFFPGDSASYCAEGDAMCRACLADAAFVRAQDSRFCVGAGGCVCVANCIDTTARAQGKVVLVCANDQEAAAQLLGGPSPGAGGGGGDDGGDRVGVIVRLLATVAATLVVLAVLLAWRLRRGRAVELARQQRRERAGRDRSIKSAELGVAQLQLDGWRSHREPMALQWTASRREEASDGNGSGEGTTATVTNYVAVQDVEMQERDDDPASGVGSVRV